MAQPPSASSARADTSTSPADGRVARADGASSPADGRTARTDGATVHAEEVRAPRRRVAVGPPRPQYLLNEENDRMMMIITALAAEVSSLRDRLDTHEALAAQGRFADGAAVDAFALDPARREARESARQAMLARVFRILFEDLDSARVGQQTAAGRVLADELKSE